MKREDADAIAAPYDDAAVFVTATGRSVVGRLAIAALMRERFAKKDTWSRSCAISPSRSERAPNVTGGTSDSGCCSQRSCSSRCA